MGRRERRVREVWGAARDAEPRADTRSRTRTRSRTVAMIENTAGMAYNYIPHLHESPERGSNPLVWRGNPPEACLGGLNRAKQRLNSG